MTQTFGLMQGVLVLAHPFDGFFPARLTHSLTLPRIVSGMAGLAIVGTVPALKGATSMILLYCFWYNVTIGATAYTIVYETSTSPLCIKTIAIGVALVLSFLTCSTPTNSSSVESWAPYLGVYLRCAWCVLVVSA